MKINSSCCRVVLWQDASSPSSPPGFFSHPSCGAESQGRRLRGLHIDAWQVRQHLKTLCIKKHSVHFSFEMVVLANSTQPTIQLTTGSVQLYPRRMKQIYPRLKQHSRSSANHWSWRKTGIFKRATCIPLSLRIHVKITDSAITLGQLQTLPQEIWGQWANPCPGGCPGYFTINFFQSSTLMDFFQW